MRIAMTQKKIRWAGQPKHVLDLATGLRKRGHEVLLISQPGSDFAARALEQGFQVSEITMTSLPKQLAGTLKLARLLRKRRIEILHCHDSHDHQMGCAAAWLGVGAAWPVFWPASVSSRRRESSAATRCGRT